MTSVLDDAYVFLTKNVVSLNPSLHVQYSGCRTFNGILERIDGSEQKTKATELPGLLFMPETMEFDPVKREGPNFVVPFQRIEDLLETLNEMENQGDEFLQKRHWALHVCALGLNYFICTLSQMLS